MALSSSSATGPNATHSLESQDVVLDTLACPPHSAARPILNRPAPPAGIVRVGRYEFADCIAKGGMATVHFARLHGDFGFCRIVAVKRLLPQYATDEQFKAMFIEEARLAARIRHPNVVSTLDVVADRDEVLLVMDYVHGDALSSLSKHLRAQPPSIAPMNITAAILSDVLRGLAFAHSTTDKDGQPLHIVHCDVSPQNILVGVDGVARVLDFGIAKATNSLADSAQGVVRGKPGYMAPEQLAGAEATPRSDLFAVGVVLWEMLTGQRLFGGAGFRASLAQRYHSEIQRPSARNPAVPPALEAVVMKALARDPSQRYGDAGEMMRALELACPPARPSAVADWVEHLAADTLVERGHLLSRLESEKRRSSPAPSSADDAHGLTLEDVRTEGISTARSLRTTREAVPHRSRRVVAALSVVAVTFGIGGVFSQRGGGTEPFVPGVVPAASSPSVAPATGAPPAPVSDALRADPIPTAVPQASEHATSSAAKATNAVALPVGATPRTSATRSVTRAPCSPPYTIDAAGRKHYRAECFR